MLPRLLICSVLGLATSLAAAANTSSSPRAHLSAAEIVEKNVAARGGLQAWRAVGTLSLEGRMGAGGNQRATLATPPPPQKPGERPAGPIPQQTYSRRPVEEFQLPFVMQLARSHKMRLELQFKGQTAVQVFDGTKGWKVRPYLNRSDVEPFSAEEMKLAAMQADLDGHLIDYAAKGTKLELVGMEKVEDRDSYKLQLTLRNGHTLHVWIDAQTFLETKMEGQPHRMDGVYHPTEVYFRDYQAVNGLQIPFVLETRVLPVGRTALGVKDTPVPVEKITIEKVVVNPKLDESVFAKPQLLAAASLPAAHARK
jgi:hypothetical protein